MTALCDPRVERETIVFEGCQWNEVWYPTKCSHCTAAPSHLDAALALVARGWAVFPLYSIDNGHCTCPRHKRCGRNAGKHPRTRNGVKDATTNTAQVRIWWRKWPTANIGVATGAVSGMYVLDVDPDEDGDLALLDIVRQDGPLSYLAHSITGGGGDHYYIPQTRERATRCTVSRLARGLDIRGDGGYVVAPPSTHLSGERYAWAA